MNQRNKNITSCFLCLSLVLLSGTNHAQENQIHTQEKMKATKMDLQKKQTRQLLIEFNDILEKAAHSSESKERKLKLYSEASSFLRSMLDQKYDPSYMAPTSTPLPDSTLSSGSDPSQISDPIKRQQAIDARNVLAAKIERHNFQRDLRKELASVVLSARTVVGATGDDSEAAFQSKLEAAGLTRDQALSIMGSETAQSGAKEK